MKLGIAGGVLAVLAVIAAIIGYSSLLVADNRALFSFGVAAVLGEISCIVCAVVALPAVLLLVSARRRRLAGPRGEEAPSSRSAS